MLLASEAIEKNISQGSHVLVVGPSPTALNDPSLLFVSSLTDRIDKLDVIDPQSRSSKIKTQDYVDGIGNIDRYLGEIAHLKRKGLDVKNHQSQTGGMMMPLFEWFLSTVRIPRALFQPHVIDEWNSEV